MRLMREECRPKLPDLLALTKEQAGQRLNNIRKFAALELKTHLTALEREANGEVTQTDQLKADHEESVDLATVVLKAIEPPEYVEYLKWLTVGDARSDLRKQSTNWPRAMCLVEPSVIQDMSLEEIQHKLDAVRREVHPRYEDGFVKSERFDNGEEKMTAAELQRATCRMNFCGMIIPQTDNAGFLFEWRQKLTDAYRDPSREMEGLI